MKNSKKGIIIRALISLLIIFVIIGILYLIFWKLGYTKLDKEDLREIIEKAGVWGPIVFIVISFLQVTLIPIPSIISILAGSLLFGPLLSIVYSFIGIFIGSILAFGLGRWIGRRFVNWIVGDKETVDQYLKKIRNKESITLFFMFILPFFPDDALCSLAGITAMTWKGFIVMQVITRIISITSTILFWSGEIIPYTPVGFMIIGVIFSVAIIAFILTMKNSEKIGSLFSRKKNKKDTKEEEI